MSKVFVDFVAAAAYPSVSHMLSLFLPPFKRFFRKVNDRSYYESYLLMVTGHSGVEQ